jgi:hypothetical protein
MTARPCETPLEQWPRAWLVLETASLLAKPGYLVLLDSEKSAQGLPLTDDEMRDFIRSRSEAVRPVPPALAPQLAALDDAMRHGAPTCERCGRPDGGVMFAGETRHDAGLVDRERCSVLACPMRFGADVALIITVGAQRP